MKAGLLVFSFALIQSIQLAAQKNCSTFTYWQQELKKDPSLAEKLNQAEWFTRQQLSGNQSTEGIRRVGGTQGNNIIRIPVVVHILYHYPSEKISDREVMTQMEALNKCFRRRSADTVNTPSYFKPLAADCEIEFELATSDPQRRSTTGIIRKYTPIKEWLADDKMKFSNEMGDDAWDPKSYLNIWVCNLHGVAGYSSVIGGADNKDGVVIGCPVFGTINTMHGFEMGKTAVHEVGHWLNLKHLWGDEYCGDDGVADTPKQAGYNIDCPGVITITCGNGPYGDMYMNYMDFTNDACMNLFTHGQKSRMRALFAPGGLRYSILFSTGLSAPLINEIPLPEESPRWLQPQLYPNPANKQLTLDLAYDMRWVGKTIRVINLQGQTLKSLVITSKTQRIEIGDLQPGMYFLAAKKDDGESMKLKFIKL